MNNTDTWWVYKLYVLVAHGAHSSITYPLPGYIQVVSSDFCAWQKIPSVRFRKYLQKCEDLGLIEDLQMTRGFVSAKIVPPAALSLTKSQ